MAPNNFGLKGTSTGKPDGSADRKKSLPQEKKRDDRSKSKKNLNRDSKSACLRAVFKRNAHKKITKHTAPSKATSASKLPKCIFPDGDMLKQLNLAYKGAMEHIITDNGDSQREENKSTNSQAPENPKLPLFVHPELDLAFNGAMHDLQNKFNYNEDGNGIQSDGGSSDGTDHHGNVKGAEAESPVSVPQQSHEELPARIKQMRAQMEELKKINSYLHLDVMQSKIFARTATKLRRQFVENVRNNGLHQHTTAFMDLLKQGLDSAVARPLGT